MFVNIRIIIVSSTSFITLFSVYYAQGMKCVCTRVCVCLCVSLFQVPEKFLGSRLL